MFGIFKNRLNDQALQENLVLPEGTNAAMFFLTVRPQNNVAIENRLIDLNQ